MTQVCSNELLAAAQVAQRQVVSELERSPHIAVLRVFSEENPEPYLPAISYAAQIKRHAGVIGVGYSERVLTPDEPNKRGEYTSQRTIPEFVKSLGHAAIDGTMPLDPFHHNIDRNKVLFEEVKDVFSFNTRQDIDDLSGKRRRAPTARAMIAMANLSMHGPDYYVGKTLDELSKLQLREDITSEHIFFGGQGKLACKPLRGILAEQGINVPEDNIATHTNPDRLHHLPSHSLIFTAIPQSPEQIKNEDLSSDTIVIDGGCGTKDGRACGNVEWCVAEREDVKWTPPRGSVGRVSTIYLFHHLLEAAGASRVPTLTKLTSSSEQQAAVA